MWGTVTFFLLQRDFAYFILHVRKESVHIYIHLNNKGFSDKASEAHEHTFNTELFLALFSKAMGDLTLEHNLK